VIVAALCWPGMSHAQIALDDPLAVRLAEIAAPQTQEADALGPIQASFLNADRPSRFVEVPVEPSACYSFFAVSDGSDDDLDLHLYADSVQVAEDVGTDSMPRLHWCNAEFQAVSLELRFYRGAGRYAFQIFRSRASGAESPLDQAVNGLAARFADGYRPAADAQHGTLATGGSEDFEIMLAAGRCYAIAAAGAETVTDLDLELRSSDGELVDMDRAPHAEPVLRHCTPITSGVFSLRVLMVEGFGDFGFRVFSD